VSLGYRVGLAAVAGLMVLLPVVYFGIIAGTCWLTWYHMTHSGAMFRGVGGRVVILLGVVYIALIIAGALLVLAMVLPLFWRSRRGPRPYWVDRREQPLLYAYVDKLCDVMRAPRPARIDLVAAANASAHIDNGVFGLLFRRRLVLTLGLSLARSMDLRQFTGVVAHELGHFAQGSSMRLSYVVHRINGWFARLAWGRSGIDDLLDGMLDVDDGHWALGLIGLLCKCVIGMARLVIKGLAIVSHALAMNLSRQAEFDADRRAARIVGGTAVGDGLQASPFIDAAFDLAEAQAAAGWRRRRRRLPDDLVAFSHALYGHLPAPLKDSITANILTSEASWFDTHPPLYKRVAALMKTKALGVMKLDAPATILFHDFDELSKLVTIVYQCNLGDQLHPEHLVALPDAVVARPA
jgi:Zn-dependent protease with chaperone function